MSNELPRQSWADSAKALCIVAVVLVHAVSFYGVLELESSLPVEAAYKTLLLSITPLRVPLFFLISGYFAARAVRRSWRTILRPRVYNNLYVYALWLGLLTLLFSTVLPFPYEDPAYDAAWYPMQFLRPVNHTWYLFALAIYFVATKILVKTHTAVWLTTGLALSVVSGVMSDWVPANVSRNLIFFLIGALAPRIVDLVVQRTSARNFIVLTLSYGVLAVPVRLLGIGEVAIANLPLSCVGIAAAIQGVVLACRWKPFERVTSQLGQRTLPIYVMHIPTLVLLLLVANISTDSMDHGVGNTILHAIFPIVATAISVALAIVVHRFCMRITVGRALFQLPKVSRPAAARVVKQPAHRL
ncbi:acyltransferase family protein [Arthrobacter sp. MA-N2]|uniref:acyltransferase family protein n=1 Tax=Arthrobacter sp. MA-N2 TaxID=1101188 RepID=UPI0018CC4D3D|nr:acyltransferase [Arthrobacter sp. MA-N2]